MRARVRVYSPTVAGRRGRALCVTGVSGECSRCAQLMPDARVGGTRALSYLSPAKRIIGQRQMRSAGLRYFPWTRTWVFVTVAGVPLGRQKAWLSSSSRGTPRERTRVAASVQ